MSTTAAAAAAKAAKAAYESAVGQPSIAGAMITASTETAAHVTMTASQPVIAAGETRSWTTDILVTDESPKPVGFPTAIDPSAVRTASPSGKSSVVFKTAPGVNGKPPKTTIQLWSA